jgi:hypothetical protein
MERLPDTAFAAVREYRSSHIVGLVSSEESFPEITGDVRYLDDNRTCVAPVRLEPGRTYVIWFNSQSQNAFRDLGNRPAVPYLMVFQTRK